MRRRPRASNALVDQVLRLLERGGRGGRQVVDRPGEPLAEGGVGLVQGLEPATPGRSARSRRSALHGPAVRRPGPARCRRVERRQQLRDRQRDRPRAVVGRHFVAPAAAVDLRLGAPGERAEDGLQVGELLRSGRRSWPSGPNQTATGYADGPAAGRCARSQRSTSPNGMSSSGAVEHGPLAVAAQERLGSAASCTASNSCGLVKKPSPNVCAAAPSTVMYRGRTRRRAPRRG